MVQRKVRLVRAARTPVRLVGRVALLVRENALLRLAAGGEPRGGALAGAFLRLVDHLLPGCPCEILLGDPRTGYLEVRGTRGFRPERGLGCRIPLGVGVTGAAARLGRPVWVPQVAADPRYIPGVARAHWELALPLRVRDRVVGVVDLESGQERRPTPGQRRYLARLAEAVAPAFARALPGEPAAPLRVLPPAGRSPLPARRDPEQLQSLLLEHRLVAAYEPLVELDGRQLVGYEARIAAPRGSAWDSPARLLAAARDPAFAASLDAARLQTALAAYAPRAGRLHLDVHAASLRRPGFLAALAGLQRSHGIGRGELVLEIPAGEASVEALRRAAAALAAVGVDLALDGFGGGAADVAALVELRPAYVKLDPTLVRGVDRDFGRRTFIESLCHFTRRTGTRAVALGLATTEELSVLRQCGVGLGQGELVGPAGPLRA